MIPPAHSAQIPGCWGQLSGPQLALCSPDPDRASLTRRPVGTPPDRPHDVPKVTQLGSEGQYRPAGFSAVGTMQTAAQLPCVWSSAPRPWARPGSALDADRTGQVFTEPCWRPATSHPSTTTPLMVFCS